MFGDECRKGVGEYPSKATEKPVTRDWKAWRSKTRVSWRSLGVDAGDGGLTLQGAEVISTNGG